MQRSESTPEVIRVREGERRDDGDAGVPTTIPLRVAREGDEAALTRPTRARGELHNGGDCRSCVARVSGWGRKSKGERELEERGSRGNGGGLLCSQGAFQAKG